MMKYTGLGEHKQVKNVEAETYHGTLTGANITRYIIIKVEPGYPSPGPHTKGSNWTYGGCQTPARGAAQQTLTSPEKKRKEATLGRQRAHARAGTSEINRVAVNDPSNDLQWAFYLTLTGLWDSLSPSPTSQAPYIAFDYPKYWPSPLESSVMSSLNIITTVQLSSAEQISTTKGKGELDVVRRRKKPYDTTPPNSKTKDELITQAIADGLFTNKGEAEKIIRQCCHEANSRSRSSKLPRSIYEPVSREAVFEDMRAIKKPLGPQRTRLPPAHITRTQILVARNYFSRDACCWPERHRGDHFSLKQRRQADRNKGRLHDMFVKLRTQNAKGRDAHRLVSPDMFKSNDYMRFDLEHPRQAVSVRVSIQENIIKTGTARPTRGPRLKC
ncbi:hypothetical protein DER46DRAFT_648194 [Fusarium sp. MPI-SDFR-AT-0072]|nr:hypothetical protein DER46DRAFT_648194 [Fusarium sp. MPI-SDFR-AT-0072]